MLEYKYVPEAVQSAVLREPTLKRRWHGIRNSTWGFFVEECSYRLSKKKWLILYSKLLYKMGHYFLDISSQRRIPEQAALVEGSQGSYLEEAKLLPRRWRTLTGGMADTGWWRNRRSTQGHRAFFGAIRKQGIAVRAPGHRRRLCTTEPRIRLRPGSKWAK